MKTHNVVMFNKDAVRSRILAECTDNKSVEFTIEPLLGFVKTSTNFCGMGNLIVSLVDLKEDYQVPMNNVCGEVKEWCIYCIVSIDGALCESVVIKFEKDLVL